jgi:WD40 repeat protein
MSPCRLLPLLFAFVTLAARTQDADAPKHVIYTPTVFQPGGKLGSSVAVDGPFTVVGEPLDDLVGPDSGTVKIFDTATGALLYTIPNPAPLLDPRYRTSNFGASVAISGTRVVLAWTSKDPNFIGNNSGRAYVYDLASVTPTVPILNLAFPLALNDFDPRLSVAISGSRLLMGSRGLYAFVYDLVGESPQHLLSIADHANSFAISGGRVVTVSTYHGIAKVYDLSSATPSIPIVTFTTPNLSQGSNSGASVAIDGQRIVVGTPGTNGEPASGGMAHVFDLSSETPTVPVANFPNPTPASSSYFANSVAISDSKVVVGAYRDNSTASVGGTAYVYDLAGETPSTPTMILNDPTPAAGDEFGTSIAVSGTHVVVGAPSDDTGAVDAGSAYLYDVSGDASPLVTFNKPAAKSGTLGPIALSGKRIAAGVSVGVHIYIF